MNRITRSISLKGFNFEMGILLFVIISQQIHPIGPIIGFLLILIRDIFNHRFNHPFNKRSILVCFILASFFLNGYYNRLVTLNNAIWLSVPSVLAIFVGYNYSIKIVDDKRIFLFLSLIAVLLALPHIYITLLDIYQTGLINPERLLSINGYDETQRSITGRTVEMSLSISCIGLFFLRKNTANKSLVRFLFIFAIITEICTLHFLSRTGVVILFLSIVIGFLFNKKKSSNSFLSILVSLVVLMFIYQKFGDLFASREIQGHSISDAGGRTELWALGIKILLENPQGFSLDGWYAHNFWIDFGLTSGLFAFYLLVFYSIYMLYIGFKIRKFDWISIDVRFIILLYSIIFPVVMFSEPVHIGSPIYMHMYFLFTFFVSGLYLRNTLIKK